MNVESKMKEAIKDSGVSMKRISEKTGIDYWKLQASMAGKRELRADEFFDICWALKVDPMDMIRVVGMEMSGQHRGEQPDNAI